MCAYTTRRLHTLLAELVALGTHVALGPLDGGQRRPARRGLRHVVDELHLDVVGMRLRVSSFPPIAAGLRRGPNTSHSVSRCWRTAVCSGLSPCRGGGQVREENNDSTHTDTIRQASYARQHAHTIASTHNGSVHIKWEIIG